MSRTAREIERASLRSKALAELCELDKELFWTGIEDDVQRANEALDRLESQI